jgi:hypothetical protein
MALFRQKPVNIEARKFITNNGPDDKGMDELVAWIIDNGGRAEHNGTAIRLRTKAVWSTANVGDWILQAPDGTFGVLSDTAFFRHYEPAVANEHEIGVQNCETSGDLGLVNGRLSNGLRIVFNDRSLIRNCVLIAD